MEKNQEVLNTFMDAWKAGDYEKMFENSQLTWKEGKTEKHIETLFSDIKLENWKLISSTTISSVSRRFAVELSLDIRGSKNKIVSVANVTCEAAPYKTATYGTWGVNPYSVTNTVQRIPEEKPLSGNDKSENDKKTVIKKKPSKKTAK